MNKIPKRIFMVAVDGSADATLAAERAAELANAERNDEIILITVVPEAKERRFGIHLPAEDKSNRKEVMNVTMHVSDSKKKAIEEEVKAGEELLNFQKTHLEKITKCKVTANLQSGDTREQLVGQALALGVDYLFLGTRGQSKLKGTLMGSVSQYVVSHAPCAVAVFHDGKE